MYNKRNIIIGLLIFGVLFTYPFWRNIGRENIVPRPETLGDQCVEPVEYMRSNHMKLLIEWKDSVQRRGVRTYVNSREETYNISLQNTCLGCHDKDKFCDECHNYAGAEPVCWDCHVVPGEKKE